MDMNQTNRLHTATRWPNDPARCHELATIDHYFADLMLVSHVRRDRMRDALCRLHDDATIKLLELKGSIS